MAHDPALETDGAVATAVRPKLAPPPQYRVIFFNDDVTPMEFVVDLLMQVFWKKRDEATQLTLKVHYEGSAVVGVYSKEVAETKREAAVQIARRLRFPLKVEFEQD